MYSSNLKFCEICEFTFLICAFFKIQLNGFTLLVFIDLLISIIKLVLSTSLSICLMSSINFKLDILKVESFKIVCSLTVSVLIIEPSPQNSRLFLAVALSSGAFRISSWSSILMLNGIGGVLIELSF